MAASSSEDPAGRMVEYQLRRRGINDPLVQQAFRSVAREAFVPADLREFAYEDTPLSIGSGQTISQPYIVAVTVQALDLRGDERVLEIGTGSGYAAAILSQLAQHVDTVERIESLAQSARERLAALGYRNVEVHCGDGSLGWPEHAPFDAIVVSAGGPSAPPALLEQLEVGGRMIIPIGSDVSSQVLTRITRNGEHEYREEPLADVRFVPLIGQQAWAETTQVVSKPRPGGSSARDLALLVREASQPLDSIDGAELDPLLERIADARLVLIGEATHGTREFYRMRARITEALIRRSGFDFVAVEADWPDAARIDDYVLGGPRRSTLEFTPFSRFPTWMWRNHEVHEFVEWLRNENAQRPPPARVGFHGLDLYSMFTSIAAVLAYLDGVDTGAAAVARERYGGLTRWQKDPAAYGRAVLVGRYASSEQPVIAMLRDMLARRFEYAQRDGELFFDAAQNARVVAGAEHYYRAMYYGASESWNLRDSHMYQTLRALLAFHGQNAKGIVWAHNSHLGDARATEMSARGEHNLGQLCRDEFGSRAYSIGFGTDRGTVAAAANWDAPMQAMRVLPAREESYEALFTRAGRPASLLHLRDPIRRELRDELEPERLERAIGVIYRPETELASHYFFANLPRQFDEYVWFEETHAVAALPPPRAAQADEVPDTYPFGL